MKYYKFYSYIFVLILSFSFVLADNTTISAMDEHEWSEDERATLRSLWIESLPPLPVDPSNKYSDNPKAVALGKKFFFDDTFSGNMKVSCATCHRTDYNFTDNLPLSHGMGTTPRRSMPLIVWSMVFLGWKKRQSVVTGFRAH